MGLRINTNIASVTALRNLSQNDRALQRSLERLSTGLRINRAADDPSGLIISERLRAQISGLNQALENTQNGVSMISVADSALNEIADLLSELNQSAIFALNTGGASPAQIAAEQFGVDNALAAIDRIAATTRYADKNLLNGNNDFPLVSPRPDLLDNLKIRSVAFSPGETERDLEVVVTRTPNRAALRIFGLSGVTAGTSLRVTGPRGTQDVSLISGATPQDLVDGINSVAGFTGVFASGGTFAGVGNVTFMSEEFGEQQFVRIELTAGNISSAGSIQFLSSSAIFASAGVGISLTPGEVIFDRGRDAQISFEGQLFEGVGRSFAVATRPATFSFDLDPDLMPISAPLAVGSAAWTVANFGLNFQLNEQPFPSDQIRFGIEAMYTSVLGFEPFRDRIEESINGISAGAAGVDQINRGGFLSTLITGRENDLFTNPGNALHITRAAIDQVSTLRAFLGSIQRQNLEPNERQLEVHVENLQSGLSKIRDLDFAEEISNFVRKQIILQSSIGVLANANTLPQAVLPLIQG